MELHGDEASLAIDRIQGTLTLGRDGSDTTIIERITDTGFVNRFETHVFPALSDQIAGHDCQHPNLQDGWMVQRFTDAAASSARGGRWEQV